MKAIVTYAAAEDYIVESIYPISGEVMEMRGTLSGDNSHQD